ncbi:aminotransferase class V-fold PLP-dependent enzyme [Parvularcula maris]|uniref:Kynureninase n=1 Tax=Parvularcula maris TaxID=2965077 RepID=A0A9X2L7E7_9PROT|nr:aminotransferase class V-fold PLP-dependent enzyme [Parvularcula maris]MCQ8184314.1 aminotransferase class V-fold PLP-dependent enzyme [Parvularcula maris]
MRSLITSLDLARHYDAEDPLGGRRALFEIPEGVTYLVGHSLGPLTRSAAARADRALRQEWGEGMVRSWNSAGWIDLAGEVGDAIAPLIGAAPGEVVVCDSVSVNLFKLAGAALPLARKRLVMVDDHEFPTDQYIAEGLAELAGGEVRRLPAGEEGYGEGGVLIRSVVSYRSGEIVDVAAAERRAREAGTVIVWDLSHAAGAVPLNLSADGARLAAGCTYKYLNGGPGAPAYVYAAEAFAEKLSSPLPGWLGHAAPFAFDSGYTPAAGVQRFVAGTPPILSLSALAGALEAFEGVSPSALHGKAGVLGDIVLQRAEGMGLAASSPKDRSKRGGHVSLSHEHGYAVVQALAEEGVLSDFRTPDTIRFGLSPLFLSAEEVWGVMDRLEDILRTKRYEEARFQVRSKVT